MHKPVAFLFFSTDLYITNKIKKMKIEPLNLRTEKFTIYELFSLSKRGKIIFNTNCVSVDRLIQGPAQSANLTAEDLQLIILNIWQGVPLKSFVFLETVGADLIPVPHTSHILSVIYLYMTDQIKLDDYGYYYESTERGLFESRTFECLIIKPSTPNIVDLTNRIQQY